MVDIWQISIVSAHQKLKIQLKGPTLETDWELRKEMVLDLELEE